jgi:UTP--glucose-1-phosphate uridylyltransferase
VNREDKTIPVRKAIIAAAGFGTRFLPQTKAMPKEMLPIVDKPIIQYVVEELVEAGIEHIIIVTGYSKRSIEDHFDNISADLDSNLKNAGKAELLNQTKKISELANFIYIRQKGPYGNATPLLNAEHLIGNEPFIYTWGDDFVLSKPSRFKQLINTHAELGGSVITCFPAQTDEDYNRYAVVRGREVKDGIMDVDQIIEKPGKEKAQSNIISVGGYLFEPKLFDYLKRERQLLKDNQEFVFQPAVQRLLEDGHKVYGCQIQNGKFHDTGNKLDYMKTAVDFALMHDDIKDDFEKFLRTKTGK